VELSARFLFKKLSILPVFRVIGLSDSHNFHRDVDESLSLRFIFTDWFVFHSIQKNFIKVVYQLFMKIGTVQTVFYYGKGKVISLRPGVAQRVGRIIALLFHDRGTRRVGSTPRPHFTPGKDPVPILQEVGWAPGPIWTGGKSHPHRDSIPNRPARCSVDIPTELPGPLYFIIGVL